MKFQEGDRVLFDMESYSSDADESEYIYSWWREKDYIIGTIEEISEKGIEATFDCEENGIYQQEVPYVRERGLDPQYFELKKCRECSGELLYSDSLDERFCPFCEK